MLKCPECSTLYNLSNDKCSNCNYAPEVQSDIELWAPEKANSTQEYHPGHYETLAKAEEKNFWFSSRKKLLNKHIKAFFPALTSFLEIGCGTGLVLSSIRELYPKADIVGSELLIEGLYYASNRIHNAKLIQMDARRIHYREAFDVIGSFDVLEHIEEDQLVISEIFKALKPGGGLVITVPQHPWLWSRTDELAGHVRRYKTREIEEKIKAAGFEVIKNTSFVSLLLPFMYVSRHFKKDKSDAYEFEIPSLLNVFFKIVMDVEIALINTGISFPIGGSRMLIAKKPDKNQH